jgi:hypothetical protein
MSRHGAKVSYKNTFYHIHLDIHTQDLQNR